MKIDPRKTTSRSSAPKLVASKGPKSAYAKGKITGKTMRTYNESGPSAMKGSIAGMKVAKSAAKIQTKRGATAARLDKKSGDSPGAKFYSSNKNFAKGYNTVVKKNNAAKKAK